MHVTLLTATTRGQTAPFAALALGLRAAGHHVRLAGPRGFAPIARAHGLDFFALEMAGVDRATPAALEQAQAEAWQACQGTGAILYDPLTLVNGYFIARQMGVPAVAAALAPLTPTAAHPAWPLYAGPRLGAAYNRLTHTITQQATWQTARAPLQKFWRQRAGYAPAGLAGPYARQHTEAVPVLYGYSAQVLPRPRDWAAHLHVTGFWRLPAPDDWRPPAALLAFLHGGPPPVYIDLQGPVLVLALAALRRAGLRGVVTAEASSALALPETVIRVDNVPQCWLLPRTAALVHAGGAAATAASLAAGVPALVAAPTLPASAWGRVLFERGLGPQPLTPPALTAPRLSQVLTALLADRRLSHALAAASDALGAEDGVGRAVAVFEAEAR